MSARLPHLARRNVRSLLKDRLPAKTLAILQRVGKVAELVDVPVYVVGGFVRDLFLRRPNLDLDVVVEGDGIAFARQLAKEYGARVKAHERFGTAVLSFPDHCKLDVATARTEFYKCPAALPIVERSSIKKDMYRRDFTINALAIRLNAYEFGELLDFYGGQRDLRERTIRVLHNLSFIDDPTRVFRAVRFECRFGFRLAGDTRSLITDAVKAKVFDQLSGSRLLEEIVRSLSEDEPGLIIRRMADLGLLRFLHPDLKYTGSMERLLKSVKNILGWYERASLSRSIQGRATVEPWRLYFMVLLEGQSAKAVEKALTRLCVPERIGEQIRTGHRAVQRLRRRLAGRMPPRPSEIYCALDGLSEETILLAMASTKSEAILHRLSAYLETYRYVKPSLTGAELKKLGLSPGPQFKKLLNRLMEARLDGEVTSENEERALVKRIAGL